MQDGTTIEIMPKIYSRVLQDEQQMKNPRIDFQSDDGVTVHVRFVDLFDVRNCIAAIANEFKE